MHLLRLLVTALKRALHRAKHLRTRPQPARATTLEMTPNPCPATDVLTLHLRGLRSCPTQVQVRSRSGELIMERRILPLSNYHRQPLVLPRDTPAGMYQFVALQPSGLALKVWLALTE